MIEPKLGMEMLPSSFDLRMEQASRPVDHGSGGMGWTDHRDDKPVSVNIDVGGLGIGVFDRLVEQGYQVNAVNFGGKPVEPPPEAGGGPLNRRAEMWGNVKKALEADTLCLPDTDSLMADLTSAGYWSDSAGRLILESKEEMRKRGMPSPDQSDAAALCFAEPAGSPIPRSVALNWNRQIAYPKGSGTPV
jgi:hypothetical protein